MAYLGNNFDAREKNKEKFYKKRWFKIFVVVVVILLLGGGIFAWKTGSILNRISKGGLLQSLVKNIPGVSNELKGEKEGRINVLLLGMRGENIPGGGLLADTIIVASINSKENKASMISIPRDLYVNNPAWGNKTKINAVYAAGEENGKKQGLEEMKKVAQEVTGLPIHYAASINFAGFKQLIDAIGGIEITLEKPFEESLQFNEPHVCDSRVFTVPTGKFEIKKRNGRITAQYPLCTNPNKECGGNFKLPAGKQTLNGDQALCYVRSRVTSSDFERAKRQQIVIQLVKDKMLSVGTLTDFSKVNAMLNALGDNVRMDMQLWEMQKGYELYKTASNLQIYQRVLENSEEGLLYNPTDMPKEVGYILLPIGGNYDRIHEMAKNIFTLPAQSDIKPK
ncbi:MAG TPA: LCP family protein [Candidatus Moranbacteria bacterium]|nr:LCP family protein [Candidatus Moranbacteria bacterium]